ncbi:hypothetical protein K6U62_16075 [Vibrio vulnificus]|nr:hypothetical protein [Vibrio vulnificus]
MSFVVKAVCGELV